jgi:hypothetical protein
VRPQLDKFEAKKEESIFEIKKVKNKSNVSNAMYATSSWGKGFS